MFRWEIFDSDVFGTTILRSLVPQVVGMVADMGLERAQVRGQRGAVALRAVAAGMEVVAAEGPHVPSATAHSTRNTTPRSGFTYRYSVVNKKINQ